MRSARLHVGRPGWSAALNALTSRRTADDMSLLNSQVRCAVTDRQAHRASAQAGNCRRIPANQLAGSTITFRPPRVAAMPNASGACASGKQWLTTAGRLTFPAAARPMARG